MTEPVNEHEMFPSAEVQAYMAEVGMPWVQRRQCFTVGDWDWDATIGVCPNGLWKARYTYDDGQIGMHGHTWYGSELADPMACYLEAKLANWGN